VYRDHGVVPKHERADNFNRTPENLGSYQLVNPGDVVFNKMKAWSGSVAVSDHRGIVSPDYLVCRVSPGLYDPRYLHFLLRCAPSFAAGGCSYTTSCTRSCASSVIKDISRVSQGAAREAAWKPTSGCLERTARWSCRPIRICSATSTHTAMVLRPLHQLRLAHDPHTRARAFKARNADDG
jgi:hypothetical protein